MNIQIDLESFNAILEENAASAQARVDANAAQLAKERDAALEHAALEQRDAALEQRDAAVRARDNATTAWSDMRNHAAQLAKERDAARAQVEVKAEYIKSTVDHHMEHHATEERLNKEIERLKAEIDQNQARVDANARKANEHFSDLHAQLEQRGARIAQQELELLAAREQLDSGVTRCAPLRAQVADLTRVRDEQVEEMEMLRREHARQAVAWLDARANDKERNADLTKLVKELEAKLDAQVGVKLALAPTELSQGGLYEAAGRYVLHQLLPDLGYLEDNAVPGVDAMIALGRFHEAALDQFDGTLAVTGGRR